MEKRFYNEIYEMIEEAIEALSIYETSKNDNSDVFNKIRAISVPCMENGHEKTSIMDDIPAKEQMKFQRAIRALPRVSALIKGPHKNAEVRNYLEYIKAQIGKLITVKSEAEHLKVFYSWQATLPNKTNRAFINDCLEKAVKEINGDIKIESRVEIDSDTRGMPGSPDIINAILRKIDKSAIFVADISIVSENQPNTNVMFELGYALKALGDEKIIMIFNEDYGEISNLPFDLGFKRQMLYKLGVDDETKSLKKNELTVRLKSAIKLIIDNQN
jgi:predicted nucleotide-binding protein